MDVGAKSMGKSFRMNESDRQQNRINCMDELYGCNSVNLWIDYMNLFDRDW